MSVDTQTQIEAAAFRRLIKHLDTHKKEVQNIDLMITGNFCRNCLAKWYSAAAEQFDQPIDYESAREIIYGEPYDQWKTKYQQPATPEQLSAYEQRPQENLLPKK